MSVVGTVWVRVSPSAVGFQQALHSQLRKDVNSVGKQLDADFEKVGQRGAKSLNKGIASTPVVMPSNSRQERAYRRTMRRQGTSAGQSFGEGMKGGVKSLGRSLTFTGSGVAAVGLGLSAYVSANFESALSAALAVAQPKALQKVADDPTGAKQYAKRFSTNVGQAFRKEAERVGKNTIFSNVEAATGLEQLVRGGLTARQALQTLEPAANLAAAGQISFADASNIAVSSMNVFSRAGLGAAEAGNKIAVASTKSQATVESLGQSIKQGGSYAADAGQSYAEMLTALSILGKEGKVGTFAGTRLKNFFNSLGGKSEKATGVIEDLGLEFYTAEGKVKSFVGIQRELQRVFKDTGKTQKEVSAALSSIFSIRGRDLATALINNDLRETKEILRDIEAASDDALESLAWAQKGPVARQFELTKGEWETALAHIGKSFESTTITALEAIENIAIAINKMEPEQVQRLAKALAAIAAIGPGLWVAGTALGQLNAVTKGLTAATDGVLGYTAAWTKAKKGSKLKGVAPTVNRLPTFVPPVGLSSSSLGGARKAGQEYADEMSKGAKEAFDKIQGKPGGGGFVPVPNLPGKLTSSLNPLKQLSKGWQKYGEWIGKSTRLTGKFLKVGGPLIILGGILEGVFEAVDRGSKFTDNLSKAWRNLADIFDEAAAGFDGVGESLTAIAEDLGLDALWGDVQSDLASMAEGFSSFAESATSSIGPAFRRAGDLVFQAVAGIRRALINLRIAYNEAPFLGSPEGLADARADEAALNVEQNAHNAAVALGKQEDAQRAATKAIEADIDAVIEKGRTYQQTKKLLSNVGLLETAVKLGKFTLDKNPRKQAELVLGKALAGKPLKVTVPITMASGEVGNFETFTKGSMPGLQELIVNENGVKRSVNVQVITSSKYTGMTDQEQSYFKAVVFPGETKPRYVRIKMKPELQLGGDSVVNANGNVQGGKYEMVPDIDEKAFEGDAGLPKIKVHGSVDGVTVDDGATVDGGLPNVPGTVGYVSVDDGATVEGKVDVPGRVSTTTVDDGATVMPMGAGPDTQVPAKEVPVVGVYQGMKEGDGATVEPLDVKLMPQAGELNTEIARISGSAEVGVDINVGDATGAEATLSSINTSIDEVQAKSHTDLFVGLESDAADEAREIQGALEDIPDPTEPTVNLNDNASDSISGVSRLLEGLDGDSATVTIFTNRQDIGGGDAADDGGGEAEGRALAAPMAARTVSATSSPTPTTTSVASTRASSSKSSLGSGGTRRYKDLLKRLKKAMRRLRTQGVASIDKTSKVMARSIKKFDKASKSKKNDNRTEALEKQQDKLQEVADKRKDTLKQLSDDTQNYLAAATRSFRFASRGSSEQIAAGVKELEDTFTLAEIPEKQKQHLRAVTAQNRAALTQMAADLEKYELAAKFKDSMTESIKGGVDWNRYVNPSDLRAKLDQVTGTMAEYQNNLTLLRSRGVDKGLIEQLAGGDPERAALLAKNLASSTTSELAALNASFASFTSQAARTADHAASAAFATTGASAMVGFSQGMANEEKALRGQIQKITNRIVKTVKRALGIKSPSTVFADIGKDMMRGIVVGMATEQVRVREQVLGAVPQGHSLSAGVSAVSNAGAPGGVAVQQTINPSPSMNERELASLVARELSWSMR